MRKLIQLAATSLLLVAGAAGAQVHPHGDKPAVEDLSWMWQYTQPAPDGHENGLTSDPRFHEFLRSHLAAPQSFWGNGKPLADVATEFLAVPGIARADENRYLTATGCVPNFCPSRGMLFVDIGSRHPLVIFAAIDWNRESHNIDEDNAEYTLWIFPDRSLAPADATDETQHLSSPLKRSLGIFSAELKGGRVPPLVTHAFVVEPNGKPHEIPASQTGVTRFHDSQPVTPAA
ncbi:MAG: hypothetical protein PW789_14160 [Edaphobacter sp.]|uniref:hypothetical protein n=1 Tax=Edaphobacter sp. TaxID=1934404 RepID=UPI0023A03535|nr:hypothetical protein [Edaphobacter sp.]MDE1177725.1 hypothetical protein [Edaphobacter sp.]